MHVYSKLCSITHVATEVSREVTSEAKSRQIRSEWTSIGVHVCLDEQWTPLGVLVSCSSTPWMNST